MRVSAVTDDQAVHDQQARGAAMTEHDSTSTHISPTPSQPSDAGVVDELMDHVAALLQSQMQAANQHLRKGAARLLDPSRTRASHEDRPSGASTDRSA
jgi:phage I-like protein